MLDINEDWLNQTANDMRELGGDDAVLPIIADVTDPESVHNAVGRTVSEMGGLHILVNQRRYQSTHRRLHHQRSLRESHRLLGHCAGGLVEGHRREPERPLHNVPRRGRAHD